MKVSILQKFCNKLAALSLQPCVNMTNEACATVMRFFLDGEIIRSVAKNMQSKTRWHRRCNTLMRYEHTLLHYFLYYLYHMANQRRLIVAFLWSLSMSAVKQQWESTNKLGVEVDTR